MIIDALHPCLSADATNVYHHLESWYFFYIYSMKLPIAGYYKFVHTLF